MRMSSDAVLVCTVGSKMEANVSDVGRQDSVGSRG